MGRIFCKMQCAPSPMSLEKSEALSERYGRLRRFYNCTGKSNDVIGYIENGATTHFGLYEDFNDGVKVGLFDKEGVCDYNKKFKYKQMLEETKSPIWSGVIILPEEFGLEYIRHGYDARKLMKETLPGFLKGAGFREDNVIWFAGLHENYVRKHIHFIFWEKEPIAINRDTGENEYSSYFIDSCVCREFEENIEKSITSCRKELERNISTSLLGFSILRERFEIKRCILDLFRLLPDVPYSNYEELTIYRYKNKLLDVARRIVKNAPEITSEISTLSAILKKKETELESYGIGIHKTNLGDEYFDIFYKDLMKEVLKEIYSRKKETPLNVNRTYKRKEMKQAQATLMREYNQIEKNLKTKALESLGSLINLANKVDVDEIIAVISLSNEKKEYTDTKIEIK